MKRILSILNIVATPVVSVISYNVILKALNPTDIGLFNGGFWASAVLWLIVAVVLAVMLWDDDDWENI